MADFDPRWANSIAGIESGGASNPYSLITPSGSRRALGKYQVMEENLPEWTQAAFGKPLTAQEYLSNPDAQDALFQHRFSHYVDKYGTPQDAASAWFTGRPLSDPSSSGASDRFGTTGASYVRKFNAGLDGVSAIKNAIKDQGRGAMAFADDDDTTGALSSNKTIGSGVLMGPGGRAAAQANGGGLEGGLMGAAAALASVYSPQQGAVLAGLRKDPADQGYTLHTMPDGTALRMNKNGKVERVPGNFAKDSDKAERVDPSILKSLNDDWGGKYGALHNAAERGAQFEDAIRSGKLDLKLAAKGKAAWENLWGTSSEQTQLYNAFQAYRTQLANDSLRLNKGVQTEGDAARAREELTTAMAGNDSKSVANALHNFVDRTGKVMNDQARSQLESYSSAYKNKAPFKTYQDRLDAQTKFYDDYTKSHPGLMVAPAGAPGAPAARPPLNSIFF
jgi:hypothetical protein